MDCHSELIYAGWINTTLHRDIVPLMCEKRESPMRPLGALLILLCSTSLLVCAQQISEADTAAIRALEHEWTEGQSNNDNRSLDLIFDNALVYVEYGKLVSKGDYLARIKQAAPQTTQITLEPLTVRIFGDTAIVVGCYTEKGVNSGKSRLKRWRFIDTWVYKKRGWVLVAAASAPMFK